MSSTRYTLEQDRAGVKAYYISRTKWTGDLAAATLFRDPKQCRDEVQILPDDIDEDKISVRAVHLTPGELIP